MENIQIDKDILSIGDFIKLNPREKYLKIRLLYDILENVKNEDNLLSIESIIEENIKEKTSEYKEMIRDLKNDINYEKENREKTISRELDYNNAIKDKEIEYLNLQLQDKDKIITEKDDLLKHWGIMNMNGSGNVAKGDLGEKILETFLNKNLSSTMKAECKVILVSKGKGHTGDLLIEIPALKKKILIESKYKDSEKVRTKEINRSMDDLISSEYDPDIILSVSFKTGFTGLEDRQIKMLQDSSKIKIFSVFENFEEYFKDGNGNLLCDWILSLVKVHDNMKDSDISKLKCIENKIEIFRKTNKSMNQSHLNMMKELKKLVELDYNISSYINEIINIIQTNNIIEINDNIVQEKSYDSMNLKELKEECKLKKLSMNGKKHELINRLNNHN